jgi:hypothetical protein
MDQQFSTSGEEIGGVNPSLRFETVAVDQVPHQRESKTVSDLVLFGETV